jgi:C4-dicarboxylate transporter DctQ subunit
MITRFLKRSIDFFEEGVIVVCMAGIAVLTFGAVLSRFIFNFSIAWSEELVRYLFVWGSMFGASYAFKYGAHSGLPILVEKFPARLNRIVHAAIGMISAALFLLIVYLASDLVVMGLESGQVSPATGIPYWVVNFGLVLAFVMCAYRVIEGLIHLLKSDL